MYTLDRVPREYQLPMPYFVYLVTHQAHSQRKSLEYVETFDTFKAARNLAREHRSTLKAEGGARDCRLIFAKNQTEAERLLSAPPEERVIGED